MVQSTTRETHLFSTKKETYEVGFRVNPGDSYPAQMAILVGLVVVSESKPPKLSGSN